jgi:hypothetical protein
MYLRKILIIFSVILLFNSGISAYSKNNAVNTVKNSIFSQTVYVPAYSSIFHGNNFKALDLAVTLSIRNTNLKNPITISKVNYYDNSGKLIKQYITGLRKINPLETVNFVIRESENTGDTGANFIIKWQAGKKVNPPLIESVMIGTSGQQGISFASRGITIDENN